MCVCFSEITWEISLPGTGTQPTQRWLLQPPSGSSTCSCLKPHSVPKQQRTGWSWHQWMVAMIQQQKGWLIPWGWALKHIWLTSYLKEGICYYISYILWWYGLEKLPKATCFHQSVYIIYFQGSSKVVNIQFFTLFKPKTTTALRSWQPKPLTVAIPTVAPRSSPSNLRLEGPNSGSWQ